MDDIILSPEKVIIRKDFLRKKSSNAYDPAKSIEREKIKQFISLKPTLEIQESQTFGELTKISSIQQLAIQPQTSKSPVKAVNVFI
jgi:hypothetical protein